MIMIITAATTKRIEKATSSDWNSSHSYEGLCESPVAVAFVTLDLLQCCGLRNYVPQLALQV